MPYFKLFTDFFASFISDKPIVINKIAIAVKAGHYYPYLHFLLGANLLWP